MQDASELTEQATTSAELSNEELDAIAFEHIEPMRATRPADNGDSHAARPRSSSPISLAGWTWPIPRPKNTKA